ncbi:MAG: phosphoenolpyruvate--protein phosphotransferase, partial [Candidatus Marinimicrobia bacterium]|nr:phosphoenolpyruvate--protein phosphotransferase [Candidatus Neomarinimicrobiota bacterium]
IAAPGIAIGKAQIYRPHEIDFIPRVKISPNDIDNEMERLNKARQAVLEDLKQIRDRIQKYLGPSYAELIDAQISILMDHNIDKEIRNYMKENLVHVPVAYRAVMNAYIQMLDDGESSFFQERILDIKDIKERVLRVLLSKTVEPFQNNSQDPVIIITKYLTPGDIIILSGDNVKGFVSELGGATSHTSLLARSLKIPMIVGIPNIANDTLFGETVIVDGFKGELILYPDYETEHLYQYHIKHLEKLNTYYVKHKNDIPITKDGKQVDLFANISLPIELQGLKEFGGMGIGLYRSEYLYLMKHTLPTEEELYQEYVYMVKFLENKPVVLRTIDLGGDKVASILEQELLHEDNPNMGYRAIRICLDHPDIFITQLKAMLRASHNGTVQIMLPMISHIEELEQALYHFERAKRMLREEKIPFDETCKIGILAEVPSAALMMDKIANMVDFISIGTNDLTQYMMAVDRGNEKVGHIYSHYDPALIRIVKWIIQAGHDHHIPISVCGEMASDPLSILLLVGLKIDILSVSPIFLGLTREIIRGISFKDVEQLTQSLLNMSKRQDIYLALYNAFTKFFPDWERRFGNSLFIKNSSL